jgi:colanic acid biosynthesis glycosyl transferase WcaI
VRVLFVTAHYPPDLGALATRARELACAWASAGHEVHVLCGMPSHPTGVVPPQWKGKLRSDEIVDGVHVHRTWVYATPNAGRVRRSAAFASFAASALLIGERRLPDPDVVLATSPQFLTAVAGALIARRRDRPFVLEIRDLWPRSIWEVGALPRRHPLIFALERVERWLYREADEIVVVTRSFRGEIARHLPGRAAESIPVVPNGVRLDRFDPALDGRAARARLGLPLDGTIALYAGTHGMAHGLGTVIEAARRAPEVHFVLVGEGACKAALVEQARGVPNVRFVDGLPAERMPELYALADVCLVPLRDLPLFETVIPSKMFEIWAMERPLVLGVRGEAAALAADSGAAVVVPPEDPGALADAVRGLASDPAAARELGRAGRRFVAENYDRDALAGRYAALLERVARRGRRRVARFSHATEAC